MSKNILNLKTAYGHNKSDLSILYEEYLDTFLYLSNIHINNESEFELKYGFQVINFVDALNLKSEIERINNTLCKLDLTVHEKNSLQVSLDLQIHFYSLLEIDLQNNLKAVQYILNNIKQIKI